MLDPQFADDDHNEIVMQGFLTMAQKLLPQGEAVDALRELSTYKQKQGLFADDLVWQAAVDMSRAIG